MTNTFEQALNGRVSAMVDACSGCGKCVEVCPVTGPAGVDAEPQAVIAGVLDILRLGEGTPAARAWANGCVLSGECIKACDYGVNPRFLLAMARTTMARQRNTPAEQRRLGVESLRKVSRDVTHLSRMQLTTDMLERLGQGKQTVQADPASPPDFVFYTGCNVLKTPHIALLCLDVMDALGVTYRVMGGPSHCCGVMQLRTGDIEMSGRVGETTVDKLSHSKSGQVLSWCPSCQVQFTETTLPTLEKMRGARPFEMTPFMHFLRQHLDRLRPLLKGQVDMRIALHRHPGVPGVMAAAEDLLRAVPGVEIVELQQPAVGLQTSSLAALPEYRHELQKRELDAAEAAGIDALVAVYHSDYRELCGHEYDYPFRIMNVLEVLAQSMGLHEQDRYKQLKLMQNVDAILTDCGDLIREHKLPVDTARDVVAAMLKEQPVPMRAQ